MHLQLNLIAAACENMGIAINGRLPWKLKSEMAFFTEITTKTEDSSKKNAVIMGRKTWESIPNKFRPLAGRLNIVISSQTLDLGNDAVACKSIPAALAMVGKEPWSQEIEKIWVIGGYGVYKEAMESPNFHRLYLTRIRKHFVCDVFFPSIPNNFVTAHDPSVPAGIQNENGIEFEYFVYEKN